MFESLQMREVRLDQYGGVTPKGLAFGKGSNPVEIIYCTAPRTPNKLTLAHLWNEWRAGRPIICLFVIQHEDKATLYGHTDATRDIYPDIPREVAERICIAALDLPTSHDAERFLRKDALRDLQRKIPGLGNEYFLAWHALENVVPVQPNWKDATTKGAKVLRFRGWDLLKEFGYEI